MTALEFLEDTVKYFSEDVSRRCKLTTSECSYAPLMEHQTGCAIGRFLDKDLRKTLHQNSNVDKVFRIAKEKDYFEQLVPEWMSKIPINILRGVQELHDINWFWEENGLSEIGEKKVQEIKELINNNI